MYHIFKIYQNVRDSFLSKNRTQVKDYERLRNYVYKEIMYSYRVFNQLKGEAYNVISIIGIADLYSLFAMK